MLCCFFIKLPFKGLGATAGKVRAVAFDTVWGCCLNASQDIFGYSQASQNTVQGRIIQIERRGFNSDHVCRDGTVFRSVPRWKSQHNRRNIQPHVHIPERYSLYFRLRCNLYGSVICSKPYRGNIQQKRRPVPSA